MEHSKSLTISFIWNDAGINVVLLNLFRMIEVTQCDWSKILNAGVISQTVNNLIPFDILISKTSAGTGRNSAVFIWNWVTQTELLNRSFETQFGPNSIIIISWKTKFEENRRMSKISSLIWNDSKKNRIVLNFFGNLTEYIQ